MLLTLVAAAFIFGGGSDAAMAASVSAATGKNLVVLADPDNRWPSVHVDYQSPIELETIIKRRYDVRFSKGVKGEPTNAIWSAGRYPYSFFHKQSLFDYVRLPQSEAKLDRTWPLTIPADPSGYLTIEQLCALTKKPTKIHWFYQKARLAVAVQNCSESELMNLIAAAVGARLVETATERRFDLNVDELRKRATALFDWKVNRKFSQSDVKDASYMLALYEWLSDAQLADLYSAPEHVVRIAIPRNSRLEKLAAERLWDIMGSPDADIRTLTQEQIRSRRDMMGRIDFSQGFQAALYSNGNPACRVPFKNSDMGLVY